MKIFICGRLGDVVKKIIESEEALTVDPKNEFIIVELAAYQQVLSMWPVLEKDKAELSQQIDILKFNIKNLVEKEKALREHNAVALWDVVAKNKYLSALDDTRASIAIINRIGMYAGLSPMLEVKDADTVGANS